MNEATLDYAQQHWCDRRNHERRRVLLSGKVVFNQRWVALDCAVRDISKSGARIHLGDWLGLPPEVELHLGRGDRYRCEIVRYADQVIGVRFHAMLQALVMGAAGSRERVLGIIS